MSARSVERALARLAAPQAVMARDRNGEGFGVFPNADRRRRPLVRVSALEARTLEAEGAIRRAGDDEFVLSEAGRARVRREGSAPAEQFAAQHRAIVDRSVIDAEGARNVRGYERAPALRRLAALKDGAGKPWLEPGELAAAAKVLADWEMAERGLVRGSDWAAPPMGSSPRAANGAEAALAQRCDARRRVADALATLAPSLRRVVERVCLYEEGLEALERAEAWPARSGKLALKLALSQLAASL
jgi:hypothetical protein